MSNISKVWSLVKNLKLYVNFYLIQNFFFLLINELYQHNEVKNHYVYTSVYDKCWNINISFNLLK